MRNHPETVAQIPHQAARLLRRIEKNPILHEWASRERYGLPFVTLSHTSVT
jgi:hypothetical protein